MADKKSFGFRVGLAGKVVVLSIKNATKATVSGTKKFGHDLKLGWKS